jgi:hypothetical protein
MHLKGQSTVDFSRLDSRLDQERKKNTALFVTLQQDGITWRRKEPLKDRKQPGGNQSQLEQENLRLREELREAREDYHKLLELYQAPRRAPEADLEKV